jgi:hypothetical protein
MPKTRRLLGMDARLADIADTRLVIVLFLQQTLETIRWISAGASQYPVFAGKHLQSTARRGGSRDPPETTDQGNGT